MSFGLAHNGTIFLDEIGEITPLRNRIDDLPTLVNYFIKNIHDQYSTQAQAVTPDGIRALQQYSWPGNIRELETFLEKLLITSDDDVIDESFISSTLQEYAGYQLMTADSSANEQATSSYNKNQILINTDSLNNMELQIIKKMLPQVNGNKQLLANMLGVSRATIWNRLKSSE